MKWNAYLFFDGKCEAAFKYYQGILGGEIPIMMKNGESPAASHTAPDKMDQILHARLVVGDNVLMASDSPFPVGDAAKCYAVSIIEPSVETAERIFNSFAADGEVRMPFEKTFYAERFGMVVDKFGILWMINAGETM